MTRPTNPNGRSRNVDENLNKPILSGHDDEPTSTTQNQTAKPKLRNIEEKNGKTIYPSIQLEEHKNKKSINNTDEAKSSFVESSTHSDEDVIDGFKKTASEPLLNSRTETNQEKNIVTTSEIGSISFFEHMAPDVIRKILFEQFIDLSDIPTTAKNLMNFASVSKFNREFVRELLAEEGLKEVSFEITKPLIPDLLAKLANDKQAEFTQVDIDNLVHNWPYLTFDSSVKENKVFINDGIEVLKKIVCHSGLKEIRIINETYINYDENEWDENHYAFNNNGPELLYSLLSRNSSNLLKIDFNLHGWFPPVNFFFQIEDKSFDMIKKIQEIAEGCGSVSFGKLDLSRFELDSYRLFNRKNPLSLINRDYQFKFVKMMCNIALTHSAHTISLRGLGLLDKELALIINEIQQSDKSTLQHLHFGDLSLEKAAVESLSTWIQSNTTCIKTLHLGLGIPEDQLDVLTIALKNNKSLEKVVIGDDYMPEDHPIKEDKRVRVVLGTF
jgi:hypothetical protein